MNLLEEDLHVIQQAIKSGDVTISVIGLGYIGLPLAVYLTSRWVLKHFMHPILCLSSMLSDLDKVV